MRRLHAEVTGKGQPIIMLHGWGSHSKIWDPLIPYLTENFQLFLIDLPGFGKSSLLTNDYNFEYIVDEIFKHIPPKAMWVGWSLGGLLAQWVAVHYPDKISHLLTIASSPRFIRDSDWPGIDFKVLDKFSNLLTTNHQKTMRDFLELQLRGSPRFADLFSALENKLLMTNQPSLAALTGGLQLLQQTDLREDFAKIQCPHLHVFGSLDTIVPREVANRLKHLNSTSQCVVFNRTGHMPFLSHTKDFLELLNQFFF